MPPDAEMREFRRGMMGDKDRDKQGPDQQKRWQEIDRFREGVGPGQNGPRRPRPPDGMRDGSKKPWPGPGPRQFKRPDPPSGQPGGKPQGSENRPPAPVFKNRPPVKAPAGNPQPKGPKSNQGQAPNQWPAPSPPRQP